MPTSSEEFDRLSEIFGGYVSADRTRFLTHIDEEMLADGMIFDFQHQTILRIAQESGFDLDLSAYSESMTYRRDLLSRLVQRHSGVGKVAAEQIEIPSAGQSYKNADFQDLAERLGRDANAPATKNLCFFSKPAGFGLFELEPYTGIDGAIDVFRTTKSVASTGAKMFYAFNTSSPDAYLQDDSIQVLGRSLHAAGQIGANPQDPRQEFAGRVLKEIPLPDRPDDLVDALTRMFASHEISHRPTHPGNGYLIETLRRNGLESDLLYRVGFPSPHELGAWPRLKAGNGDITDMLFMYGDTLANIAWLQHEPDEETVLALMIFLTWLIKEPGEKSAARGNNMLFAYLMDRDLPRLIETTCDLVQSCLTFPERSADLMRRAEQKAWKRIADAL